jgi:hypothetical protein
MISLCVTKWPLIYINPPETVQNIVLPKIIDNGALGPGGRVAVVKPPPEYI